MLAEWGRVPVFTPCPFRRDPTLIALVLTALTLLPVAASTSPASIRSVPCASVILVDAKSGSVLHEQNADAVRGPASLVKMMVELIVLEEVAAKRISLNERVKTSAHAATMGGTQVYLKEGETHTVRELLAAAAIASANDAAVALAEHVAGSEPAFVERMNRRAKELGCKSTRFANAHGLDLRGQSQATTSARDLALIARALVRHPLALELSSTRRAPFRDGKFWLESTNHLLGRLDGVDGLKTGWTPRAGACFCATAERARTRLISVVLGAPRGEGRFSVTRQLLEDAFAVRSRKSKA
jgi:D-alanyl-D-alanine carboxypeptidase (penicillin-binding protein 5/6)